MGYESLRYHLGDNTATGRTMNPQAIPESRGRARCTAMQSPVCGTSLIVKRVSYITLGSAGALHIRLTQGMHDRLGTHFNLRALECLFYNDSEM